MVNKKTKIKSIKKNEKVRPLTVEKEQNKQLIIFFTIMLLVLGSLIGGYLYVQQQNKFSYAGVEFTKVKEGQLTYYHGKFPINYKGQTLKIFNVYLRINPKKNNIPINTPLSLSEKVVISFEPGLEKCPLAIVGHSAMSQFISVFPWVKDVTGAVNNREYALENNMNFADCSNATKDKTIILARTSQVQSIEKEGDNCYVLNVGDCGYLALSERYVIGVIAQINEAKL